MSRPRRAKARKTSAKPKRRKRKQPAAPSAAELWPQRFVGLSPKRADAIVAKASALAGEAMKRALRVRHDNVTTLDPVAAIVAADAAVVRLIGKPVAPLAGASLPSPIASKGSARKQSEGDAEDDAEDDASAWPDQDAPSWIAVEYGGVFAAVVRIGFRGARVVGQSEPDKGAALARKELRGKDAVYNSGIAKDRAWKKHRWQARYGVEASRLYSFEALQEAVTAARTALRHAGCVLAAQFEVEQRHNGQSAVAAIWVRTLSPALRRSPIMAR